MTNLQMPVRHAFNRVEGKRNSAYRRPPVPGGIADRPGWGGRMVKIRRFRIGKLGSARRQRQHSEQRRGRKEERAQRTAMRFITLVVDMSPLAVVSRFANRMLVVEQQIVEAVQRPGGREHDGQQDSPKAAQRRFCLQRNAILTAKVKSNRKRTIPTNG